MNAQIWKLGSLNLRDRSRISSILFEELRAYDQLLAIMMGISWTGTRNLFHGRDFLGSFSLENHGIWRVR